MVLTRSRKRVARSTQNSNKDAVIFDNEPTTLPPKAKRARTTSAAAATTKAGAAARTRKGRALKPVATNAISNSNARDSAGIPVKQSRGVGAKAKVSSTKVASSSIDQRKNAGAQKKQSETKKYEDQRRFQPIQQRDDIKSSSTGATRARGDDASKKTSTFHPSNALPKSATTTSSDNRETGPSSGTTSGSSSYQNGIPDNIDARDAHDPLSVTDYVEDMYNHFRSKEGVSCIDRMYMGDGKQHHINESMRCILVDWLIEVHYKFKLFPETLYLTVNILDRFLADSEELITKRDLQLVGVTSLLIAAKYEEMYVPELRDLTYICDGAYTEAKILQMEEKILRTLNYNVTVPTPHTFLIRFLKAAHADKLMAQLACFLLDGTLLSLETLTCRWRPSQLAAAAILLARRQLGRHNWSPTLVAYSKYREEDVLPVARALLKNKHRLEENRELMALAKKYSKTKYGKVSHIVFLPLESSEESLYSSEDGEVSIDDSEL
mmetsp:Transcript_10704/g.25754  ORF Transcript_10704/g.25754 Transcript_10704/m.25754 type:complete len:494 (+) Transcript_10704:391-1872(+)|eukprot:CAMPEP_0197186026 /NCGR_PEP_ID=MMETSP1423-20130617/13050_1 /TAXON_ID=476441 /ORGANISM="Pseudo-nitzschia heimii, Strain UNC1101" /LENGTH=493 /DNA_ID=CAMNT_0042637225 /DNA_START=331 /DNA_END=1815 /DNA_ORIENTATION=-